ncbi:3-isopropylmalate dehydratase small subunit [Temperatibacter marinus]|uniref:3-isopropylmalate dehydratase small subunit n=1 Tax=Temperatibacter marinus TaxID=1456591 RepID=A0AA52EJR7_9PROT|nr:3-isopropylmalate dehydratase small subunit [Temperatibacter marinus]WND03539.1 3-isopropylmalate dehydratase small subunit [Temperatibacter marinus]
MDPFIKHKGTVAFIDRANVDTDAIMPKQYLKSIKKFGYGDWLFDDWRYLDPGDINRPIETRRINEDFELNKPEYKGASILVAQENFGCGSSREHAVWGLRDYGIRCVIAPSFADIFMQNCFNNGLLALEIAQETVDTLIRAKAPVQMDINLEQQTLTLDEKKVIQFTIEESRKYKLLNGLDTISMTLQKADKIKTFEKYHAEKEPWVFIDL